MAPIVYEAAVFERELTYKNFKGETKSTMLYFALDPLKLLQVMAGYTPRKIRSGNPALNGKDREMSDEEQIVLIRNLAVQAAGFPSEDGESWIPYEDFEQSLAGKAFLTKLISSDADRTEFSLKVILNPFRAFVGYAEQDPSNSAKEIANFKEMLSKMENIFKTPEPGSETAEERRARLMAELNMIDGKTIPGTVVE